jgi:hypothetical protein
MTIRMHPWHPWVVGNTDGRKNPDSRAILLVNIGSVEGNGVNSGVEWLYGCRGARNRAKNVGPGGGHKLPDQGRTYGGRLNRSRVYCTVYQNTRGGQRARVAR